MVRGGGVCGALLATQLRRNEAWEVHCFEKRHCKVRALSRATSLPKTLSRPPPRPSRLT